MAKICIFIPIVILMVIINFLNPGIVASSLHCENDNPSMSGVFNFMKTIQLTKGYETMVDDEDFNELNKHKWCAVKGGKGGTHYALRFITTTPGKQIHVSMHREILNPPTHLFVDHKDGNGLNNQRNNLRFASAMQNQANRRPKRNGSSMYRGVSLCNKYKIGGKTQAWRARLVSGGEQIYEGFFDNEVDAAKAYDEVALKTHGEFARLNFPTSK